MAFKPRDLTRLQQSEKPSSPRGLPQPTSRLDACNERSAAPFKPGAGFYSTGAHRVFTPLNPNSFFDVIENKETSRGSFRVYSKGQSGPRLIFLHGGGHSGASWACLTDQLSQLCECRVLAFDARGHGATTVEGDEHDLSLETQCDDFKMLLDQVIPSDDIPNVVVGHSMGGAIAAHACARGLVPNLGGLIVIDVVEGTAMDALSGMMRFLRSRPVTFESEEAAIKWALRNGQLRNCESARVSMPPQLTAATTAVVNARTSRQLSNTLAEEPEDEDEALPSNEGNSSKVPFQEPASVDKETGELTWRVDLSQSAPYWEGWFKGLSKTFLSVPGPKMLLLAAMDRLDKDLMIGQMQGKFQLQVIANAGHCVHEDAPGQAGAVIAEFLKRYSLLKS
eukprot:m.63268 g.63268  ORF g.63268 m.63268 type:complete len:394 (-) comp13963_c1_seq3:1439-2620(-)